MSQEESIRDLLKSGRKNRRKNGLYKSHHKGHAKRAKTPKVSLPWRSPVLPVVSDNSSVNREISQT